MEVFRDFPSSHDLSAFCKQDASKREFSDELRNIMEVSATTGLYWHNWDELRTLLLFRLMEVLQDYYKSHVDVAVGPPRPLVTGESYQELEDRLVTGLESFTDGAPFTLQRFCEVLLNPRDRYPNLDKVALAFEKLLLVTSTFPPSSGPYPGVESVPASTSPIPTPTPTPTPAKDVDQKPAELPTSEILDSDPKMDPTINESNDFPVQHDLREKPAASVVADAVMVDVESTETKEVPMDIDAPQPSGTVAANEGSREDASEISAGKEEWQLVDAADSAASPPTEVYLQSAPIVASNEPEANLQSAPIEASNEPEGDITATST